MKKLVFKLAVVAMAVFGFAAKWAIKPIVAAGVMYSFTAKAQAPYEYGDFSSQRLYWLYGGNDPTDAYNIMFMTRDTIQFNQYLFKFENLSTTNTVTAANSKMMWLASNGFLSVTSFSDIVIPSSQISGLPNSSYYAGSGLSLNSGTFTNTSPNITPTITGTGITSVNQSGESFTITSTEVDGSVTNEIQSLSLIGNTVSLTGGGDIVIPTQTVATTISQAGAVTVSGSYPNFTISAPAQTTQVVPASSLALSGQSLSIVGSNTVVLPQAPDQFNLIAGVGTSTSGAYPNITITNTSPNINPTIVGSGITSVNQSGSNYTITSTEVDGSITNEIQTLSINGQALSLSNGGGSVAIPSSTMAQTSITGSNNISVLGSFPNFTVGSVPSSAVGYGTGTAYALTTTSAKIDLGTTDPEVTLPSAGTWLILSNLKIEYNGLTTLAVAACNFKLRRVNNTAADLTNATSTFNVPVVTLLTQTGGDCDINAVIYTTSTSGDNIQMFGSRGAITVGSINVSDAYVLALRLY